VLVSDVGYRLILAGSYRSFTLLYTNQYKIFRKIAIPPVANTPTVVKQRFSCGLLGGLVPPPP